VIGNPTVDFHGEGRHNDTDESSTDGDALLARKGQGKEAELSITAICSRRTATGGL
jgi:hypothetical protein